MATEFQITFDADDPPALAAFWQLAMGYVAEPPPPGFATWEEFAAANDIPPEQVANYGSAVDPAGKRPRMLFLKVPEGKTAKNRMHLDLLVPDPEAHVARLVEAGGTEVETRSEMGTTWTVMLDPEQNEFCVAKAHEGPDNTAHEGPDNTAHEGPDNTAHEGPDNTAHEGPDNTADD